MKTVIVGLGRHAHVLRSRLYLRNVVMGDPNDLDSIEQWKSRGRFLVGVGVGRNGDTRFRSDIWFAMLKRGWEPWRYVDTTALHGEISSTIGAGSQLLPNAFVGNEATIGANVIVNTGAIVEHDCEIHDHVFIGPGAVICGGCKVGEGAFIGAGSVLLPETQVSVETVIGAGAVCPGKVYHSTKEAFVGSPARLVSRWKRIRAVFK